MKTLTSYELMTISGGNKNYADYCYHLFIVSSGAIIGATLTAQLPIVQDALYHDMDAIAIVGCVQITAGAMIGLFAADTLGQYNLATRANNEATNSSYAMSV